MADLSDVEQSIVSAVTQAVYPRGTASGSAVTQPCRIYRGWPSRHNLDADLRDGVANISIFSLPGEQNLTRYTTDWQELPSPKVNLTMTIAGVTVTVGGTPNCPLNAAILVNGKAFVYPLQANDTPTTVATALAALISSVTPATNIGHVITIAGAKSLTTRIGTVGLVIQEVKRQKKSIRITTWCNDPLVRDAIAKIVDPALATMTFISLPDGSAGRIRYERTAPDDMTQKALIYRRDLIYSVEYGTTNVQYGADVVSEIINLSGGLDTASPAIKTINL
jgi:hypothetical protein